MSDTYKNIVAGQWQIGDIVFGTGTTIKVETVDVKPYDIEDQDYQVARTNERRFGLDYFKPSTIEITAHVLKNRLLPQWANSIPNFWADMPTVSQLANEWRSDEARMTWGQIRPLYYCDKFTGVSKIVYGRPGQFGYAFDDRFGQGEVTKVIMEFRRADTLAYSVTESSASLSQAAANTITRSVGDGPDAWCRIVLNGPVTNPAFILNGKTFQLKTSIASGKSVEISSYPWARRVVNSDGVNLAASFSGYLDQLTIPYNKATTTQWISAEYNSWVPSLGNQAWSETFDGTQILSLPSTFTQIAGQSTVKFDIINFFNGPTKYLTAKEFSNKSAVLYNANQFSSSNQYAQVNPVKHGTGKSGIVIMSNSNMTSFACLIVENTVSGRFLRIATASGSPTNLTVRASWQNSAYWSEGNTIAFAYEPSTKTYTGYINGVAKINWTDSTSMVSTANRYQGFLFDIDGNMLTDGMGFTNLVAYDRGITPAATGSAMIYWRDSYSVI